MAHRELYSHSEGKRGLIQYLYICAVRVFLKHQRVFSFRSSQSGKGSKGSVPKPCVAVSCQSHARFSLVHLDSMRDNLCLSVALRQHSNHCISLGIPAEQVNAKSVQGIDVPGQPQRCHLTRSNDDPFLEVGRTKPGMERGLRPNEGCSLLDTLQHRSSVGYHPQRLLRYRLKDRLDSRSNVHTQVPSSQIYIPEQTKIPARIFQPR